MLRIVFAALPLLLTMARPSPAADKPYPIYTPETLANTMKLLGRNFAAVNASLAKSEFETAKAQLTRSRELLASTVVFWRNRRQDDAVKILKGTVMKMDDLDAVLSVEKIDPAQASAIVKQIGAGCQTCHATYREQDPNTKRFRLKIAPAQ